MRREAVLSSRIEGTRATLAELYTYESAQLSFIESGNDVREVHNYVTALDYGLERLKTLPISLRLIRELHEKLMQGVRGANLTSGEFRRTQNWIGPAGNTIMTATYVPPPVDEMHQGMDDLEKFIHARTDVPALARAAMIHYQFEALHPFLDGNGRVGRLLMALLYAGWNILPQPLLNLSVYFERYRQEYYDRLLAVSQRGDWDAWLRFFMRGVSIQAQDTLMRMDLLEAIRPKCQPLVEAEKNSERIFVSMLFFSISLPFMRAATVSYPDEDALASFLRLFNGFSTAAAFLASLFLANRLFARFGIMACILVLPVIYLIGFAGLTVAPIFQIIVAFRFVQVLWISGIADSAWQAMFNVVPPERRDQVRALSAGCRNRRAPSLPAAF